MGSSVQDASLFGEPQPQTLRAETVRTSENSIRSESRTEIGVEGGSFSSRSQLAWLDTKGCTLVVAGKRKELPSGALGSIALL